MKNILLVVANASRAQIWAIRGGELSPLEDLAHPESRAKGIDLTSDRAGRSFDDGGGVGRSSMEAPTDPREVQQLNFAREVTRRTSIQARRGQFAEILLFAPPRFLGRMKARLDTSLSRRLLATISHDYTAKTRAELIDILAAMGIAAVPARAPAG